MYIIGKVAVLQKSFAGVDFARERTSIDKINGVFERAEVSPELKTALEKEGVKFFDNPKLAGEYIRKEWATAQTPVKDQKPAADAGKQNTDTLKKGKP